jgi:photosystem II stability/assembly factor-like uncharacterized protein
MVRVLAYLFCVAITITSGAVQADDWKKITHSTPPVVGEWGELKTLEAILALSDSRILVAVGRSGLIRRSDDGGRTWSNKPSRTSTELYAITELSDHRTLIALGREGAVLRSGDAGETWDAPTQQGNQDLYGVAAVPTTNIVVAVGDDDTVLLSKDRGLNWARQIVHVANNLAGAAPLRDRRAPLASSTGHDYTL